MADAELIDLVSDTATRPSAGMLEAMMRAPTGDEQLSEDPTTTALCERIAQMTGKQAAVFLPSGIMSNLIAVMVHCAPGDEVICARHAHLITSESGAPAVLGGVSITPIDSADGIFDAEAVRERLRPARSRAPRSRLLHLEQTSNRGGGAIWPLATIEEVAAVAHDAGLAVHMDGARLLNAVIASNVAMDAFCAPCDSVWLDLSKGLGAPVGSVLAGSEEFIENAWTWKHRLGGAMRQSGVLAAAGLYALDHHVQRLGEDHANAQLFASLIEDIAGIQLDPPRVQTNLVFFDVSGTGHRAETIMQALRAKGVRIGAQGASRMRAVTHLDVTTEQLRLAAQTLRTVVDEL